MLSEKTKAKSATDEGGILVEPRDLSKLVQFY